MNNETFEKLLVSLEGLTGEQRGLVSGRVKVLTEHADTTRLAIERLGNPAACPHCADTRVVRFGRVRGQQRMRCKPCGKTFTPLTGTPFLRLRDKGELLAYTGCMSRSETIRSAANGVKLTVDRSFRWRHRFLECLAGQRNGPRE
jgi:transposase-like protein